MRRLKIAIAAFAILTAVVPIAALAATSLFEDVPDDSIFVNDINWIKEAGVTRGCNPPSNTKYCPKGIVTREQMAAFLHRLASNRVVDAGTVEGLNATELKGQQGNDGPSGPVGPQGDQGEKGNKGDKGQDGVSPEPPRPASDGWVGLGQGPGKVTLLMVPAGTVISTLRVESLGGNRCVFLLASSAGELWESTGLTVGKAAEAQWDVGIRSDGSLSVFLDFDVYAGGQCEGSATWTGYNSAGYVSSHGFNTLSPNADPATWTEAQVPNGVVVGSIGQGFSIDANLPPACEARIREGASTVFRSRNLSATSPTINLGAGIVSGADTWFGIRGRCESPVYWTTIAVGEWRAP